MKVSRPLLSGKDAPPSTCGLLANALYTLASGLSAAPHSSRQDLRLQLMLLFASVAARAAPGGAAARARDLGALLPAVAAAVEGLQPRTLQLLGGSSNRMSIHDIQVGAVYPLIDNAHIVFDHRMGGCASLHVPACLLPTTTNHQPTTH